MFTVIPYYVHVINVLLDVIMENVDRLLLLTTVSFNCNCFKWQFTSLLRHQVECSRQIIPRHQKPLFSIVTPP